MKRTIFFILTIAILLPLLVSCGREVLEDNLLHETETEAENVSTAEEEEKTTGPIPQSEREKNMVKILVLGDSHTNDVFFQLARVFNAQGYENRYTIGFLYYSSCSLLQHVDFGTMNKKVYDYYKTSDTSYTKLEECTLKRALEDQQWDYIFLNASSSELRSEDLNLPFRRKLEDLINKYVPTEHKICWHTSWPNTTDETFYSPDWYRQPPVGFKDRLMQYYGFNRVTEHSIYLNTVTNNILNDPTYDKKICTGAGIMYATQVLNVPQTELYRDYTHLSDFGRVIASYSFYAQFTGQPIEEVKLDMIPARARNAHYQPEGDFVLTDEQKEIVKQCANYSLQSPWIMPE